MRIIRYKSSTIIYNNYIYTCCKYRLIVCIVNISIPFFVLIIIIGLLIATAQCLAPVLNSTLQPGQPVYPGQEIVFYCESRGSFVAWQSDRYIGTGGAQLEFAFYSSPNTTHRARVNQNTVATLISINSRSSGYVLVTKLRIIALASVSVATVTCLTVDNNNPTEISFVITGSYNNTMHV